MSHVLCCPACGGTASTQVGSEAPAFDSVVDGRTFRQPAYSVRCCADCGLYFKSHMLPMEQLGAYYSQLDSATFEGDEFFPTDRRLRAALERLPDGSKVLDFGCGIGRILKDLTRRFACYGVEPNEQAAAQARARGIQIVSEGELRTGRLGGFDAILLADVYEHLPKPVDVIEMLAQQLSPGGWLAMVTGNADAIPHRLHVAEFWYFRVPGHLIMASDRHLAWLARTLGLRVQSIERCSHYDTPVKDRWRQAIQAFAYYQFRQSPRGIASAALRLIPRLRHAERWPTAPALTYGQDHVVVLLGKPS